jgi:hypothetical protein
MLNKIYAAIAALVGIIGAVVAIFYRGKSVGKKLEQDKQKDAIIETTKVVQDVREEVAAMSAAERDKRMQSYYID